MNQIRKLSNLNFKFDALSCCPLCQCEVMLPGGRIRWLEMNFWYVICPKCGLKFMNPRPTLASYRQFYRDFFWQQKIRNLGYHQEGQMWQGKRYKWDNEKRWDPEYGRENRMEKQRKQKTPVIIKTIKRHHRLGAHTRVLEVGCGYGVTLHELHKKYGCPVYGIEPSSEAKGQIRRFGTIKLLGKYAEDLKKLKEKKLLFDVIVFSHVLENTVDPVQVMRLAKSCLEKKNGIIYLQTPNLLVYDQMNPYHPFIFSHKSLSVLAQKAQLGIRPLSGFIDRMLTVIMFNSKTKNA